ncbi:MAG TPA: hypothetical protein VIE90_06070 [Candidatus Binatia bacterium]|jgi:hypothetical protein
MRIKLIVPLAAALLLIGCESPEGTRTRGGGRGADLGYRGDTVEMHAGAEPYYETPQLIDAKIAGAEGGDQRQASKK